MATNYIYAFNSNHYSVYYSVLLYIISKVYFLFCFLFLFCFEAYITIKCFLLVLYAQYEGSDIAEKNNITALALFATSITRINLASSCL